MRPGRLPAAFFLFAFFNYLMSYENLDPSVQAKFERIAAKDPNGQSAEEWFEHLVPEELQDSSFETQTYMDGGTVTQEVYVHDQGRAGGHYETVEHQIADRDVSRIQSGQNGGEYTTDNTIMEDSSINRSRGGDNMTGEEFEAAEVAETVDTELIDGAMEPMAELAEGAGEAAGLLEGTGELLGSVLPLTVGVTCGLACAKEWVPDDAEHATLKKAGVAGAMTGVAYYGTALALSNPLVAAGVTIYGIYKVGTFIHRRFQAS